MPPSSAEHVSANLLRRAEQQTDRKKVVARKQSVVTFSPQMDGGQITDLSNDISYERLSADKES